MPPRILSRNKITASSMLTISSTSVSFPKGNLIDEIVGTVHRSATAGATVTYDVDFSAATAVTELAIRKHNLTSAGTFSLLYGATSPPTNAATLGAVTPDVWVSFFGSKTARYWRLNVRQSIASGFYEMGELWLGTYDEFTRHHAIGWSKGREEGHVMHETQGGARWYLAGYQRRTLRLPLRRIDNGNDVSVWETIFKNRGQTKPFFFTRDTAVPSATLFCRVGTPLEFGQQFLERFNVDIVLEEEL